ncbi:MAG: Hsp20/alpha crystallin family protein [Planctomycetes bacterium]|nr:Hsp20/alpha crystallin family protein [Planctomycetota bacterium]MCK5578053.1 Hsp20/alpha crystallin family protein [Planctomycetota bacterium]
MTLMQMEKKRPVRCDDPKTPGVVVGHDSKGFQEVILSSHRLVMMFREQAWHPPTDVYETPEEIVIKVDISGIKVEDVTVTLEGNKLMLIGKRYDRDKRVKRVFKQMEINYGKFERTIELHSYFDPKATRASYKNGYLDIVLRKVKKARKLNKPIQINFSK